MCRALSSLTVHSFHSLWLRPIPAQLAADLLCSLSALFFISPLSPSVFLLSSLLLPPVFVMFHYKFIWLLL